MIGALNKRNIIQIIPNQADLILDFISAYEGHKLFEAIKNQVEWKQQTLCLFGKSVKSPRLVAWYGEANAYYEYAGTFNIPLPWIPPLLEIKNSVESYLKTTFNSALINLYRDGKDSMSRHSDNEKELGKEPMIASLSLGASRHFVFHNAVNKATPNIKFALPHGALLIMKGANQKQWRHSVPKTKRSMGQRINITFRQIL